MLRAPTSVYPLLSRGSWLLNKPISCCLVPGRATTQSHSVQAVSVTATSVINKPASVVKEKLQLSSNLIPPQIIASCIIEDSNSNIMAKSISSPEKLTVGKLTKYYSMLAKFRLTGLVVWSAVTGYAMAPGATDLSTLMLCLMGTALTSASANTINQYFEVPFDSQMARTSNRVLVRGLLSPLHAVSFAAVSGTAGLFVLYYGVNGLCASLGALTLFLYTMVYTPMKRTSIFNTWVGSVVGALPPLMGYAGCTGYLDAGGLLVGAVLYAWQFPHFNALSWNLRSDYSRAGYRMMAVTDPGLCRRTTLRYSLALTAICTAAPMIDLTTWMFALDSLPINLYFAYLSWTFYKNADSSSSRKLFRFSLAHLPLILLLMYIHKKDRLSEDDENSLKEQDWLLNVLQRTVVNMKAS